jgi:hypothetical protein
MSRAVDSDRRGRNAAWITLTGLGVLAAYAWLRAIQISWLCDDAFISIRYADNLASGLGLVYNAGERVEGYTNLLWTLMLAAAARAGVSPVATARYLGIVWYVALTLSLTYRSWRRTDSQRPFLPLAAGIVLVSDDFQIWATGGLETSLFAWLSVQALMLTRLPPTRSRAAVAGCLFALLVMTRPDGLLFAAAGALSFWFPRERLTRTRCIHLTLALATPVLVLLGVGIPAKLSYYGELLPTAFYSKSVLEPYVSQGLWYLGLFLYKNWFLIAAAIVGIALRRQTTPAPNHQRTADGAFYLATAAAFTLYLIEVGGDFMFARRLIPVVPLLLIAIEDRIAAMPRGRLRPLAAGGLVIAAALPVPLYGDTPQDIHGVYDERLSYPPETLRLREQQGIAVGRALADVPVRVAFEGGMCVFGYYSRLPYLAEMTGLTQYSLAKRALTERGAIGHEKSPSPEWFADNRIHILIKRERPPLPPDSTEAIDEIRFGNLVRGQLLVYADEVMNPLRGRPEVSFTPIEEVIARAKALIQSSSIAQAEAIYAQLDRYYFHSAGPQGHEPAARLREIISRKRAAVPEPATPTEASRSTTHPR